MREELRPSHGIYLYLYSIHVMNVFAVYIVRFQWDLNRNLVFDVHSYCEGMAAQSQS